MLSHFRVVTVTVSFFLVLFTVSVGQAQNLTIPQIADGGGWQTTLVLTNTGLSATSASLSFFKETGAGDRSTQPWNLPLSENVSIQSLELPVGGTIFLHTQATSPATSVGWGVVLASSDVVAYSIFTFRTPGQPDQEGTAPAVAGARRVLVPFDNTSGTSTAVAVINPGAAGVTPTVSIRTDTGTVTTSSLPLMPPQGHASFFLPQQFPATAGQRGLMEVDSGATGNIAMIALSFNPTNSFTTAPVYPEGGAPILSSGGGSSSGGTPTFSVVKIDGTFAPQGQSNYIVGIGISTSGNATVASMTGASSLTTSSQVPVFLASWQSVSVNGLTYTMSTLIPSSSIMETGTNAYPITSATMTLTLSSPDASGNGTVSGTLTVTSAFATLTGTVSGTYSGTQIGVD